MWIFDSSFVANFLENVPEKEFFNIGQYPVKMWTRVRCLFFWLTVTVYIDSHKISLLTASLGIQELGLQMRERQSNDRRCWQKPELAPHGRNELGRCLSTDRIWCIGLPASGEMNQPGCCGCWGGCHGNLRRKAKQIRRGRYVSCTRHHTSSSSRVIDGFVTGLVAV